MKVKYVDGKYKADKKPKGDAVGHLIEVPDGYDLVIKRGDLWKDAVAAGAIMVLDGRNWRVYSGCFDTSEFFCISVKKLMNWYKEQLAIKTTEIAQIKKNLRELEDE